MTLVGGSVDAEARGGGWGSPPQRPSQESLCPGTFPGRGLSDQPHGLPRVQASAILCPRVALCGTVVRGSLIQYKLPPCLFSPGYSERRLGKIREIWKCI